jgi:hypothetical protein
MARRDSDRHDDWADDEPDWNADDEDLYVPPEEDDQPTVACPYCNRDIHEQSIRCPYCERYLSREDMSEDAPPSRKPWWIVIGALLAMYVVYRWIVPP